LNQPISGLSPPNAELSHTLMPQQGIQLGFATTEGFERLHRWSAATGF
jgi:hypothetical protein